MPVDKRIVDEQIARLGGIDDRFIKTELEHLNQVMTYGETIHGITRVYTRLFGNEDRSWCVVITDKRLMFLSRGKRHLEHHEIDITKINSVTYKKGWLLGEIQTNAVTITNVEKSDVQKIAETIMDLVSKAKEVRPILEHSGDKRGDVVSELERLASLRNQGILSDDEFSQLKAKILSQ